MKNICVFCGSSIGKNPLYIKAAEELGFHLAKKKLNLIYGGANVGIMGAVAKSCMLNGGNTIGVITKALMKMDIAQENLTDLKIVDTMHERKSIMNDISDAFVALPGGIGTIEETFEIFTWIQLGLINKPLAFLNISGFFNQLIDFLRNMVDEGFLRIEHFDMLIIDSDITGILDRIDNYTHRVVEKWFDKDKNRV